jgi:hypothetical protein
LVNKGVPIEKFVVDGKLAKRSAGGGALSGFEV